MGDYEGMCFFSNTYWWLIYPKIWIFIFAGSNHKNYVDYLLEMYCLFQYDAQQTLKDAIFNNWLVNIEGELSKWIKCDLLQEHCNKWLENLVDAHDGQFSDDFYCKIVAPSIDGFLHLKEEFQSAFEFK